MSSILWKVRANKQFSAVVKGMEVDVVVENRGGKPYIKEIAQALVRKYGIKDLTSSGMPESVFDFTKG